MQLICNKNRFPLEPCMLVVYTNSNFQYKKNPAKWYTNSENGAVGKTFDMYLKYVIRIYFGFQREIRRGME